MTRKTIIAICSLILMPISLQAKDRTLTFSISPFKLTTINKDLDLSFATTYSSYTDKKETFIEYQRNMFKSTDLLSGIEVKADEHKGIVQFDLNQLSDSITLFSLATYNRRKEGAILIVQHNIQIGPLGLKYEIINDHDIIKDFDISYIPLYEYLHENIESRIVSELYEKSVRRTIRNSFRIKLKTKLTKKLSFKNTVFIKPAYNLNTSEFQSDDIIYDNQAKLTYHFTESNSISYQNNITRNERNKTELGLPTTESVHYLYINFENTF